MSLTVLRQLCDVSKISALLEEYPNSTIQKMLFLRNVLIFLCQILLDHLAVFNQLYSLNIEIQTSLKMIGKGFYRKWVKSSFEQFITTQTRVGSTNGWIISQNAEILKFYF